MLPKKKAYYFFFPDDFCDEEPLRSEAISDEMCFATPIVSTRLSLTARKVKTARSRRGPLREW